MDPYIEKRFQNLSPGEEYVARRIIEAVSIAKKLPPLVVPAYVCIWPEIQRTAYERRYEMRSFRNLALSVSPEELRKLQEVQKWILQLKVSQRHILWLVALNYSWRELAKKLKKGRGNIKKEWVKALGQVLRLIRMPHFPSEGRLVKRANWGCLARRQNWLEQ